MSNEQTLSRKAVRGLPWIAAEKWISRLLTLLVFVILGRILPPSDFGLIALATALTTIIAVFVEYGLAQSIVQRSEITKADIWTAFWTGVAGSVLLYGIVLALTPVLVAVYDEPQLASIIPVLGLVLPIAGLASVPAALLERELKFKPLAIRQLCGAFAGAAVAIVLALTGAGIWALVLQPVVVAFVGTVILWAAARWVPRFTFSLVSLKSMWAFSLQVVLIELMNALQSNVDKFIIGIFFSATELGFYFMAQRILTIVMEVVASVLAKISLPTLSRLQNDQARFLSYFYTLTFGSAVIAFPIFGLLIGFGSEITTFLFGTGWDASVPLMILMAPSAMLASVTFFDRSVLLAKGRGGASLSVAAGQFAFGTVVLLAAVPFGLAAVSAGRTIRQVAYWPVRIVALRRYGGVSARSYLARFIPPTVATIGLVGVAWALGLTGWADAPVPIFSFVLPASIICLAVYGGLVLLLGRRDVKEIYSVVRRSFGRSKPAGKE